MSPFCDIRCGLEREELVRVHLASIYCLFFLFFFFSLVSFSLLPFLFGTLEGDHVLLCKEFVGETDSML